jgi:hypothetical protein
MMIAVEGLARRLCVVPFVGSAVLGTDLLVSAGADARLLERLLGGEIRVPVAFDARLRRVARFGERGAIVWDAAGADAALMVGPDGRLVAVEATGTRLEGADLTRCLLRLADEPRIIDLGALGVPVGTDAWSRWEALELTFLAADLVGLMDGALAAAVDYSQHRVQFDTRIGAFQAVQHLCSESYALLEGARSATWHAAWAVDARAPGEALRAARTAKAFASEAALAVTETAIQVHGGVAITWETLPHVYLRRALLSRRTGGDEHIQFAELAGEALDVGPGISARP